MKNLTCSIHKIIYEHIEKHAPNKLRTFYTKRLEKNLRRNHYATT